MRKEYLDPVNMDDLSGPADEYEDAVVDETLVRARGKRGFSGALTSTYTWNLNSASRKRAASDEDERMSDADTAEEDKSSTEVDVSSKTIPVRSSPPKIQAGLANQLDTPSHPPTSKFTFNIPPHPRPRRFTSSNMPLHLSPLRYDSSSTSTFPPAPPAPRPSTYTFPPITYSDTPVRSLPPDIQRFYLHIVQATLDGLLNASEWESKGVDDLVFACAEWVKKEVPEPEEG
jgi:hypothetical protein